ncbi:MAG TPA: PEGA domain-containing protein [Verrucomicrobiae bacterium]|nr:PEGA domain-containing protein [Verrucomicrobiae bacterium]
MDFLDTNYERRSRLTLLTGYCLVTVAIVGAALVLLYQAYGYTLNRQGQVTQSGLVFVSSQPSGSSIYLNGQPYQSQTNARVTIPAGPYNMEITRPGYRNWERPIYVAGGDVQHFDYPLLIPSTLKPTPLSNLSDTPTLVTQSSNHRWLLLDRPDTPGSFTLWDLNNAKQPVSSVITLPADTLTASDSTEGWALEEWASDNRHVVLVHTYTNKGTTDHEYILLDTQSPNDSINLTYGLNLSQSQVLSLFDNRTAQAYVYTPEDESLERVNISDGSVVSKLSHVVAYKTYADKEILYVTDQPPNGKITPGQVSVVLQDGQQSYTLRTLPAGAPSYDLNLAQYSGDWYVVVAASNDSSVYVYKDPQSQTVTSPDAYPAPWRRMTVNDPTYVAFSSNTQFLLAEGGQKFDVYDLENVDQYVYATQSPIDQPQTHATWMDGDRLMYVSDGKLVIFDYDDRNTQTLMPASAANTPVFDVAYTHAYAVVPNDKNVDESILTTTPLLTPADQ